MFTSTAPPRASATVFFAGLLTAGLVQNAEAQTVPPTLIVEGDETFAFEGVLDLDLPERDFRDFDPDVLIRDNATFRVDGSIAGSNSNRLTLRVEDSGQLDLNLFRTGLTDSSSTGLPRIDATDDARLTLRGNFPQPFPFDVSFDDITLSDRATAEIDQANLNAGDQTITLNDEAQLTARDSRVSDDVILRDQSRFTAIDSQVSALSASGTSQATLIGGRLTSSVVQFTGAFTDQAQLDLDGVTLSGPGSVLRTLSFSGQSEGRLRGQTTLREPVGFSLSDESSLFIEDGDYVVSPGSAGINNLIAARDRSAVEISGGQYSFDVPQEAGDSARLLELSDQASAVISGGVFVDDADSLARAAALSSEEIAELVSRRAPFVGTTIDGITGPSLALVLNDESQLILVGDPDTFAVNGRFLDLMGAEELSPNDLPAIGVLSAVLADGSPFEATYGLAENATITFRAQSTGTPPNAVPTPSALAGGLFLGLGLLRRRH